MGGSFGTAGIAGGERVSSERMPANLSAGIDTRETSNSSQRVPVQVSVSVSAS